MEAMTMEEFEKLKDSTYEDLIESAEQIEKVIQISDNCQALLKKWEKRKPFISIRFVNCIDELKQAIGKEK